MGCLTSDLGLGRLTKRSRSKWLRATLSEMKVGQSFGFGDQVADPKPPRAALVKSHGGGRCGNVGTMIPAGTVERGERKRTVQRKAAAFNRWHEPDDARVSSPDL